MTSSDPECGHDGAAPDARAPGMLPWALIMAFIMNARLAIVILVVIPL